MGIKRHIYSFDNDENCVVASSRLESFSRFAKSYLCLLPPHGLTVFSGHGRDCSPFL